MKYHDLVIEASDAKVERDPDKRRWRRFKVRVLSSRVGDMTPEQAVPVQCNENDLQDRLRGLDRRELDRDGLLVLGCLLGLLLLPPGQDDAGIGVRELFSRSLDRAEQENAGLRMRLRLPPELAAIPWEYLYLERVGATDGMAGFLALDPRIAIVRHEALPISAPSPRVTGDIAVLAALASPLNLDLLDLDREEHDLRQALSQQGGVQLTVLKDATLDEVQKALLNTSVFHFAGHGIFQQQSGDLPGTVTGAGSLALDDGMVDAEKLGVHLRGNQVRLVVLGGCETGRRAGAYVWGGIAPALVRFEMPAVVANQYSILDKCAIAFSRQFYCALAGGLPIERAVSAGRIAAYSVDQNGRDWGVPVLYLRTADGELFEGAADAKVREAARQSAEADVNVRVREVAAGGFALGAKVREMLSGKLRVEVNVAGTVYGTVVGGELETLRGGSANVNVQADTVGPGGRFIGATIDSLGGDNSRKVSVDVGSVTDGQVIGTQVNQREGDIIHGNQVNAASGGQTSVNTGISGPVHITGPVTFIQGPAGTQPSAGPVPGADEHTVEERVRLDVALPKSAVVNEPFDLVIAVRQPDAPTLAIADLDHVVFAEGSIFPSEEHDVVKYRIKVTGVGFQITPPSYLLALRPGANLRPVAFQVTSSRLGKRSLLVNAYQEDGALVVQTRLTIEVVVAVAPA